MPTEGSFDKNNGAVTSHTFSKQWHPNTREKLLAHKYKRYPDNVFTPNVPMLDMKGKDVLEYCNSFPGIQFYIGPKNLESSEFSVITLQKVNDYPDWFLPEQHKARWSANNLERWELREYISLYLLDWYLPEMDIQWKTAQQLGMLCLDTLTDIFCNFETSVRTIIKHVGCTITDESKFVYMCNYWSSGQDKIWQDWENYVQYKMGNFSELSGDVVHEAMIQYWLRQQGTELRCYGLNKFPNSEELKQYYE